MQGTDLDQGNWSTDILPNPRKPADAVALTGGPDRVGGHRAAEASLQRVQVMRQPVADVEEGGSIELAIAGPLPGMAGDGSPPAGDLAAGNAAQQLSEIRPESDVGLFGDIEVAVDSAFPMDGSRSAAIRHPNADSLVPDTGLRAWKANAATEFVPAPTRLTHVTMAGLADHLPLLLGAAILVSQGGLRLEEKDSQREQRLLCIEDLRQSPNQ